MVTAGNASGINDGAAAVVVMSAAQGRRAGRSSRALRLVARAEAGVEPVDHGRRPDPRGPEGARRRPA